MSSTVWHLQRPMGPSIMVTPPPGPDFVVTGAVFAGGALFVGSHGGFLRVADEQAGWFTEFVGVQRGSFVLPGPQQVSGAVGALTADDEGYVWAVEGWTGHGSADLRVFPAQPEDWEGDDAAGPLEPRYPRLLRCRAPVSAMAGDPLGAGVWVYGSDANGMASVVHIDPTMAAPLPPEDAPPSAMPDDALPPKLADPVLAADRQGRVWLAGDTLDGSMVHMFDGRTFAEMTPPPELLRGRRFTQLMAGADGRLYASTDGVGVLVLDDGTWGPHPIDDSLPTLEGTGLKPVSCMTLDSEGNLWVGMDNNIICWRPDEPQ